MTPRFPCVRCGRPLRRRGASRSRPRHIECARCRFVIYDCPRIAAGLLVLRGDAVLLVRRAHPPRTGCLDIPGGFVEAGETLEAAARRELREETSLTLGAAHPLGSWWDEYSLRGFGRFPTLNFYYAGWWRRGVARAADDAAEALWVPLAETPRRGTEMAWRHMPAVLRALRRWRRDRRT